MSLEQKTITRHNWSRVLSRTFTYKEKAYGDFYFVAGLLAIDKVTSPLKKTIGGEELILADAGYYWLQIAPNGESWWLTVMLDPDGNIVQYYFDITAENILDGGNSRFYDLFLDVVFLPDGQSTILDSDELDIALQDGVITREQHRHAAETADRLIKQVALRFDELKGFVSALFEELSA